MTLQRIAQLHRNLRDLASKKAPVGDLRPLSGVDPDWALAVFRAQLITRHLDAAALRLRADGRGFYTITSAGHEGNAALGWLSRSTDPALLHYRSGGLFVARALAAAATGDPGAKAGAVDPIAAVLLGLTASADDPIAGGRHKVFGSVELGVLPQTSTIGSQLPKAVGVALCLDRAGRLGRTPRLGERPLPPDTVAITSLGDASLNHASSTVAFNAARWVSHQGLPLPLLFVCEDNGLGISVRTPGGWTERYLKGLSPLPYFAADGWDLSATMLATEAALAHCRSRRAPAVLHLRCARLLGHSGADPDATYRAPAELQAAEKLDPVWHSAASLLHAGVLTGQALLDLDNELAERVQAESERASVRPKLRTAQEVMAPLFRHHPDAVLADARRVDFARGPVDHVAAEPPEAQPPQPMARLINWALHELLAKYDHALLFGEDVAEKGGVYNITAGLWKRFGAGRVFNTLLDETTILALAQGAGLLGMLAVPEIQYLAFLHNAEDQLRGEAASTSFFSRAQLQCPMVVRVAGYGYQRGFGGHFHNDNSIAVLRDIPGLIIATPSSGADAVRLLRTCFAAAAVDGRVVAFVEPIALYHQRDLMEPGDGAWAERYPAPGEAIGYGEVGLHGPADPDVVVVTYGNGVRMARRVARRWSAQRGARIAVLDLRWLSPLPHAAVRAAIAGVDRVLVLDECRRDGGVGEAIVADIACHTSRHLPDSAPAPRIELVTAKASFVPLGDAAELVLPSEADIEAALERLG